MCCLQQLQEQFHGPGRIEYPAIECNPRYNGASNPTAVAQKLNIEQWLARTFKTDRRSLEDVDLSGLAYNPAIGEGIIMINWGPTLVGKCASGFTTKKMVHGWIENGGETYCRF